jgi:hypothetical protein
MYIKVITTDKEFNSVKNEWIDFEKKVDNKNITSSYLWQRTWWKHFGHIDNSQYGYDKKLSIFFLYNEKKELRTIAPFCIVKRKFKKIFHYTIVEFIAQQWGATYLDFISSNLSKNEFDYVFDWLKKNRKYDLIHLCYIPEFTSNFDLKGENATVLSGCPEVEGESYSDVREKYYSKNLQHKLNRIHNKIIRENININNIIMNGENILNSVNNISFVSKSKEYSGKHSIYLDTKKESFIKDLIFNFSGKSNCILLFYNKKLCAYNLGFYYHKKYFAFDASYNRKIIELANYSIGNITFDKLLEDTILKGIDKFCFGTGIDSYKLGFTKKVCKIYSVLYKGNNLTSGLIYKKRLSMDKHTENNFLKELKEKIPQEKLN